MPRLAGAENPRPVSHETGLRLAESHALLGARAPSCRRWRVFAALVVPLPGLALGAFTKFDAVLLRFAILSLALGLLATLPAWRRGGVEITRPPR